MTTSTVRWAARAAALVLGIGASAIGLPAAAHADSGPNNETYLSDTGLQFAGFSWSRINFPSGGYGAGDPIPLVPTVLGTPSWMPGLTPAPAPWNPNVTFDAVQKAVTNQTTAQAAAAAAAAANPQPAPVGPAPVGPAPVGPAPVGPAPVGPAPVGPPQNQPAFVDCASALLVANMSGPLATLQQNQLRTNAQAFVNYFHCAQPTTCASLAPLGNFMGPLNPAMEAQRQAAHAQEVALGCPTR